MAEMMLNMMMVFADAERKMIRSRVQEGIDGAIAEGKRVGRPPFGYTVEDEFLQQVPSEYIRAQNYIREVRKGREKRTTARCFEIPRRKCAVSSNGQKKTTTSHSITISGELNGLRSKLVRKTSDLLLIRILNRSDLSVLHRNR